jgi:hypothetical protein
MTDPKPRPNDDRYIRVLRAMTPEQRLLNSFELHELGKELMRAGIRQRNPGASEEDVNRMLVEGLPKCHNRNY